MCWNAEVSIVAFIIGMFMTMVVSVIAVKQRKPYLVALALGWSWVICMQLFEFFIWRNQEIPSASNEFYSRWAYLFNVTQVIVLALLFLTLFDNYPKRNRYIATIILFVYISYLLYNSPKNMIVKGGGCGTPHLQYSWWDELPMGSMVYLVSLILIFILIVRPLYWSLATLGVIMSFLGISWIFYSKSVASMWCFFAVLVPLCSLFLSDL